MDFKAICQLAEETRDETYGILCGHDRWGYEVVGFYSDIVSTEPEGPTESDFRRLKRIKAENVAVYRKAVEETGEFSYDDAVHTDEVAQHRAELAWVAAGIKAGFIDPITEYDLLDA